MRGIFGRTPLLAAMGGVLLLLLPTLGADFYWQRQVMLIAVYTLLVSGLNLSFGYAGELALGQVAVFAVGAYTAGILFSRGHHDLVPAFVVAVLVAAIAGLVSGLPGLRLSHWSLAIVSLFFMLLIPSAVSIFEQYTGGTSGISGIFGSTLFGVLIDAQDLYYVAIGVTILWMAVFRNMIVSRFGRFLKVLAESPTLVETMGGSVYRIRLMAYVIGALPAGLAGVLYAHMTSFVLYDAFTMTVLVAILAATVLGGSDSVWGAPVGAAILVLGPLQTASFERYSIAVYGAFLVIVGALFSSGIAGLVRQLVARLKRRAAARRSAAMESIEEVPIGSLEIPGGRLEVSGITKAFAGIKALNDVNLVVEPGTITAIIGANGAGKTTLLNVISGVLRPDSGSVKLAGHELAGLRANAVARVGVGRTFQTPLIPRTMAVLETVETGRLRHGGIGLISAILRLPRYYRTKKRDHEAALAALSFAGMLPLAYRNSSSLPLGTRRLLEVVRAVAGEPQVLLLDEPAAGLDDDGLRELSLLMRRTRDAGGTVVLVEHNVPFVMELADRVFAMELGRVIAGGTPYEVRRDQRVIDSYLGRRGQNNDSVDELEVS